MRVRTEDEPTLDKPVAPIKADTLRPTRPSQPPALTTAPRMPTAPDSFSQRLPWILVGLLAVALLALAGYIAMS
jgi:hypothetical protein